MLKARHLIVACAALLLAGCADTSTLSRGLAPPDLATVTRSGLELRQLPAPRRSLDVAVYAFADQTGQQKPSDNFSRFSKAVTQGGASLLIDTLSDVGGRRWFNVVEREGLQNLLTERNLIEQTNQAYRGTQNALPPLRFAGIILEGGIIGYDSNSQTGGIGARLLGVGVSTQYRVDLITVALRAVSVQTGEVLASVTTQKTLYSIAVGNDIFRFVSADKIFEFDSGQSANEPVYIAVQQAIELAVYALIMEGAERQVWSFADPGKQARLLADYRERQRRPILSYPQQERRTVTGARVSTANIAAAVAAPVKALVKTPAKPAKAAAGS
jgi:curli production assembly/transport component CsgG